MRQPHRDSSYLDILRGTPPVMAVVGVLAGLVAFVVLYSAVAQGVVWLFWWGAGSPGSFVDYYKLAAAYEIPWGLVGLHLGIATLIPVSFLFMQVLHGTSPKWLWSVLGRIRWRFLLVSFGVALVVINGLFLVRQSFPLVLSPQKDFWLFVVIVLLTSPLQAIAEEVFFRGYLMQALGALVQGPWFSIVGSAFVFAFLHGTQNLPLFLDRLGFGLLAGVLVWRTGGLEAGIAAHVVNNVFAFVWAGLLTSIAEVKAVTEVGWPQMGWDLLTFGIFAVVSLLVARRGALDDRVLIGSSGGV